MDIAEARRIFNAGGLTSALIVKVHWNGDLVWHLTFRTVKGLVVGLSSQRDPDHYRAFKSVNAAVSAAKQVGFNSVVVEDLQK